MLLLEYEPWNADVLGEKNVVKFEENMKYLALAKPTCRRCYGRGFILRDFPGRWRRKEICKCVHNRIELDEYREKQKQTKKWSYPIGRV